MSTCPHVLPLQMQLLGGLSTNTSGPLSPFVLLFVCFRLNITIMLTRGATDLLPAEAHCCCLHSPHVCSERAVRGGVSRYALGYGKHTGVEQDGRRSGARPKPGTFLRPRLRSAPRIVWCADPNWVTCSDLGSVTIRCTPTEDPSKPWVWQS